MNQLTRVTPTTTLSVQSVPTGNGYAVASVPATPMSCYERYVDLTPEIVADMRDWCRECVSGMAEYDEDAEIDEASDNAIVRWVAKQYDGGVRQFCLDGNY